MMTGGHRPRRGCDWRRHCAKDGCGDGRRSWGILVASRAAQAWRGRIGDMALGMCGGPASTRRSRRTGIYPGSRRRSSPGHTGPPVRQVVIVGGQVDVDVASSRSGRPLDAQHDSSSNVADKLTCPRLAPRSRLTRGCCSKRRDLDSSQTHSPRSAADITAPSQKVGCDERLSRLTPTPTGLLSLSAVG